MEGTAKASEAGGHQNQNTELRSRRGSFTKRLHVYFSDDFGGLRLRLPSLGQAPNSTRR
jgi:hypothetical protein